MRSLRNEIVIILYNGDNVLYISNYSSIKFDLLKNMQLMLYEHKKVLYFVMNKQVNLKRNTKKGKNHFYLLIVI